MSNPSIEKIKKYTFIKKIKQLPFVDKVILFGSRARGDNKVRSDIDIAIVCQRARDEDWFKVVDIVDNADTLLEIDCVNFDKVDQDFKNRILKDGIEL